MGFWSGLGKIALKAAPIAASFIPGVGPLAAMAIGAGTGALGKKISGGGAGSMIGGALEGGATGYGAGKLGGIGPSAKAGGGIKSVLGNVAKQAVPEILAGARESSDSSPQVASTGRGIGPSQAQGRMDQSSPNLAYALERGKRQAIQNQPFREGYDVNTLGEEDQVTTNRMPPIYPTGRRMRVH